LTLVLVLHETNSQAGLAIPQAPSPSMDAPSTASNASL
jgi:hypothetical protein